MGQPVRRCSSPNSSRITVPGGVLVAQNAFRPGQSTDASGDFRRKGRLGIREAMPVPGTGTPAISQWPEGVSLPGEISVAAPYKPSGVAPRSGASRPEARPDRLRPDPAGPGLAGAVFAPAMRSTVAAACTSRPSLKKRSASGAPPMPTEPITTRKARDIVGLSLLAGACFARLRGLRNMAADRGRQQRRPRSCMPPERAAMAASASASVAAWTWPASSPSVGSVRRRADRTGRPTRWSTASPARIRPPPSSDHRVAKGGGVNTPTKPAGAGMGRMTGAAARRRPPAGRHTPRAADT